MTTERLKPNLAITRILAAPRDLVWKAWTDPKQVEQWWGPHGFTNPQCEWDARPGRFGVRYGVADERHVS